MADRPLDTVVRTMSTAPTHRSSARIISQPNRVLMDLAGLDLPGRPVASSRLVRRNSTAAIHQSENLDEVEEGVAASDKHIADPYDKAIWEAIQRALDRRDEKTAYALIDYYRSPREPGVFAEKPDPAFKDLPLPAGFTTQTYNVCLRTLVSFRRPGGSIALILELYNEMLDNNCIPNAATYGYVIRALCEREVDVWSAVKAWKEDKKWTEWRNEKLGLEPDAELEAQKEAVIEGYKAEGNFDSAFKLFKASFLIQSEKSSLPHEAYRYFLLAAGAREGAGTVDVAMDVFKAGLNRRLFGNRLWQADLMSAYGHAKDLDSLKELWGSFAENDLQGKYQDAFNFVDKKLYVDDFTQHVLRGRLSVWRAAAIAFVRAGEPEAGLEIIQLMAQSSNGQGQPPKASPNDLATFNFAIAEEDPARAIKLFEEMGVQPSQLIPNNLSQYLGLLIYGGTFDQLYDFAHLPYFTEETVPHGHAGDVIIRALDAARDPAVADKALALINHWRTLQRADIDLDALRLHTAIMIQQDRLDDIADTMRNWSHASARRLSPEAYAAGLAIIESVIAQMPLSLTSLTSYVLATEGYFDISTNEVIPVVMGQTYLDARAKVASALDLNLMPGQWGCIIRSMIGYPTDDAELDQSLVQIGQDLSELKHRHFDRLDDLTDMPYMRYYAERLTQRVGKERAYQLLIAPFGQARTELWTGLKAPSTTPAPAAAPEEAETAPTPALTEDSETIASSFSFPPTPETAPEPTFPRNVDVSQLVISPELGIRIDSHTHRSTSVTPQSAYQTHQRTMRVAGQVAHPAYLARLLDNLARVGLETEARELYALAHAITQSLLDPIAQPTSWAAVENAMLIACCHLGYLEEAGMYRARLLERGLVPSADSYATMIASSKDTTDDALVARELYDESRAFGVKPNLFLYNTIISKLSKARKAEMALDLFKAMKEARVRPSSVTYGAVINACCRVGDGESAAVLFNEMASQPDFRPRVPPFK